MRASGVNAVIMRVTGKLEQKKMCAIGNARIGIARITGFYSIKKNIFCFHGLNNIDKLFKSLFKIFVTLNCKMIIDMDRL